MSVSVVFLSCSLLFILLAPFVPVLHTEPSFKYWVVEFFDFHVSLLGLSYLAAAVVGWVSPRPASDV